MIINIKKSVKLVLSCFTSVCLLFACMQVRADDYYVDAVKGNDGYAGTSADSAWKTLNHVNSAAIKPGDRVLFRRGQIWRGTLKIVSGEINNPVVYSSFGPDSLPKPRIIGSVDLSSPDVWLPAGENLWKTIPDRAEVSSSSADFARRDWNIYCARQAEVKLEIDSSEDGKKLFRLTCLKSGSRPTDIQLNNRPFKIEIDGSYVYRFRARATIPFTVGNIRLLKSSSPWTCYGSVGGTLRFDKEWKEFELLCESDTDAEDGRLSMFLGKDIPADCVFEIVPLGAFEAAVSTLGLKADVGNIILAKNSKADKTAAFKRWNLESLKRQGDFYSDPLSPSAGSRTLYFYSEKNPAEVYGFIEAALKIPTASMAGRKWFVIDGLAFGYTAAHGINGAGVRNSIIKNCDFFWIGGGHLYTRNNNPTRYGNGIEFWCAAENNLVENCRFWQIYDTAMTNQGPDKCRIRNMIWRNNVIYLCEQAYEIWLTHKESEVESLLYEGNRSYDCGFGWGHVQRPNKNGTHILAYRLESGKVNITYRNNVFYNAANALIWYFNPRLDEMNCNNNIYWQDGAEPEKQNLFMWKGWEKPSASFEEYKAQTGNDSDSRFEQVERIEYFDY
ncbi:MAG: right-handed parallel beta-helix repeat-containing protein [Kiritimatiellia bacterium]